MNDANQQLTLPFDGTGRRGFTPLRVVRHGDTFWLKGLVHIEGVTLRVVASPNGIAITEATLDADLRERMEADLTAEAEKLNRHREQSASQKRGGKAA